MVTMPETLDIPVPVRWTDLDAYGHVNNAAMVRLLEEARIAAFCTP
jgi:acyl-CoA thioester hydrolase